MDKNSLAIDPNAVVGTREEARALLAEALSVTSVPAYLEPLLSSLSEQPTSSQSARSFVHATAKALRQLATMHPDYEELDTLAHAAIAQLAGLTQRSNAWEPGIGRVMAQEQEVWEELHKRIQGIEPGGFRERLQQFTRELGWWAATGELTAELYQLQRSLYVDTNSEIADLLLSIRQRVHPPQAFQSVNGLLGDLSAHDVGSIADQIRRDGLAIVPNALPQEVCAELEAFARTTPLIVQQGPPELMTLAEAERTKCVRFKTRTEDTLAREDLLRLRFDPTIVAVAEAYLGAEVSSNISFLRWNRRVGSQPDNTAAQLYHFDLNHLNFLKVFIYLTDVDSTNGPLCFVKGSHRKKPMAVMQDGRRSDEEIAASYPAEDILELTGKRGTVVLADSRGFHKGKLVGQGQRLVYFLDYVASRGGKHTDTVHIKGSPWSRGQKSRYPRLWHGVELS